MMEGKAEWWKEDQGSAFTSVRECRSREGVAGGRRIARVTNEPTTSSIQDATRT